MSDYRVWLILVNHGNCPPLASVCVVSDLKACLMLFIEVMIMMQSRAAAQR
jgi:hypothetical protein